MTKRRADMSPAEKERACATRRAAYQRKREQELTYAAAYRDANREQLRERNRSRSAGRIEYLRAYYRRNKGRITDRTQAWREANRERVALLNSEWRKNNPIKHCQAQHARRARVAGVGGQLSADVAVRLYAEQSGLCTCCHEPLNGDFHIDHIVPISRGGANVDDNVQLLRARCNLRKGAMTHSEYMARKESV